MNVSLLCNRIEIVKWRFCAFTIPCSFRICLFASRLWYLMSLSRHNAAITRYAGLVKGVGSNINNVSSFTNLLSRGKGLFQYVVPWASCLARICQKPQNFTATNYRHSACVCIFIYTLSWNDTVLNPEFFLSYWT